MVDVYVGRWIVALATLRALTVVVRGDELAGVLFLAGCLAVWAHRSPWFLAAGATCCSMLMPHQTGSVVLFAWVAACFALFTGPDLVRALRVQVVVVYAFAATHKLAPTFLSGDVIHAQVPALPYPQLAAVSVVCVEAFLAVAVWKRWPVALPVAVVAHTCFVMGMSQNFVHMLALGAFNAHICILVGVVVGQLRIATEPTVQPKTSGSVHT